MPREDSGDGERSAGGTAWEAAGVVRHRIQAQPSDRVGVGKDYDIRVRHQNCNEITSTGWNADFQNEQLNLPMTQMFRIWVPSFLNTIAACSGKGEGMEL